MFKVEKFEGPLDLLLSLIEQEKLVITEVSLAKVTDQYILHIQSLSQEYHIEELSNFLVIAAKLLLMKSRALIPFISQQEEQEFEELENQLKIYKAFHDASLILGKRASTQQRLFMRPASQTFVQPMFSPGSLTVEKLHSALLHTLSLIDIPKKITSLSFDIRITIQEKIHHLLNALKSRAQISFKTLISKAESRTEIIVSFLALLELVKQRSLTATQGTLFEDIIIQNKNQ